MSHWVYHLYEIHLMYGLNWSFLWILACNWCKGRVSDLNPCNWLNCNNDCNQWVLICYLMISCRTWKCFSWETLLLSFHLPARKGKSCLISILRVRIINRYLDVFGCESPYLQCGLRVRLTALGDDSRVRLFRPCWALHALYCCTVYMCMINTASTIYWIHPYA